MNDISSCVIIPFLLSSNRYVDSRRKVLLDHVHEGYEKDWWVYTESDAKVDK
jgi:hypothetical protein